MRYSVGLQDSFDFSTVSTIVAVLLVAVALILLLLGRYLKNKNYIDNAGNYRRRSQTKLKESYMKQIEAIERNFYDGKIDMRQAHQKMSMTVRRFVQDSTGKRVENLCLAEIEGLHSKKLTELVRQCYEPEFAFTSDANTKQAIAKSKELIRTWL